jgi:hypothetical protein
MTRTRSTFLALVAVLLSPMAANADVILEETFDDPLGSFYTDWLGTNSNIGSYYLSSGQNCDPDHRGNNPEGLWISGNQSCGGGVTGSLVEIIFDSAFGSSLTALSFGIEAFVQLEIFAYDMSDALLGSAVFSGGSFGFDHADIFSISSTNGISRFVLDSSAYGAGQVSGNTSVDNFSATTSTSVPEPGTLALLGIGLLGMGAARRRKKA